MPVARIITVHPERTDALLKQLESEGYSVEVVRPGNAVSPADLEIDFEICPEEHALDRAVELAEQLHSDIAVAPGLKLGPETVEQPAARSLEPIFAPEPPQVEAPAHEREASATAPVQQADTSPAQPVTSPSKEDVSVPPAVWMAAAEPLRRQPEAFARDAATHEPEEAFVQRPSEEPAGLSFPAVEGPGIAQKVTQALVAAWDGARQLGHEYKQRCGLRVAEFKAERQRRLLELEKRKALAQERANELQAARDAASARLQELLRERGGEPAAASAVPAETANAPTPAAQQNEQPPSPDIGSWRARMSLWLGRRHAPQIQAILTGAAAMAALFVLGLALASFRPRPALSNSLDHPYEGVTVKGGGVTLKPATPPSAVKTLRPSPAVRSPQASGKQSPAHKAAPVKRSNFGDDVTVKQFAGTGSGGGGGTRAGDATVRQAKPPKPAPKSTPQAGLKHISDLDN